MSLLTILKGAKVFLIVGVLSLGLMTVRDFMKDQRNLRDSIITVNAEKVSAQARAQTLETANAQLEKKAEINLRFREATKIALENLNETFTGIRLEQAHQSQVLEGNRLSTLANSRKQNLIERLSNKATRARFDEVEKVFDGS